jgi:hypothetical protein
MNRTSELPGLALFRDGMVLGGRLRTSGRVERLLETLADLEIAENAHSRHGMLRSGHLLTSGRVERPLKTR